MRHRATCALSLSPNCPERPGNTAAREQRQRAARRVVDRAGDASRVLPQHPTCTYFRYRLCVTDGFHFFVCLPIFRYKLWLRGVWGDPARSMLMELHSSNYIPVLGLSVILLNRCRNANRGLAAWKTVRKCTIRIEKKFFFGSWGTPTLAKFCHRLCSN